MPLTTSTASDRIRNYLLLGFGPGLHVVGKFRDKRADHDIVGMGVIRPVDYEHDIGEDPQLLVAGLELRTRSPSRVGPTD